MNLDLSSDQLALQDSVVRLAQPFMASPSSGVADWLDGRPLYERLQEAGFLDVALTAEFGPLGALLVLEAISRSPYAVPVAIDLLVAPMAFAEPVQGPIALMRAGDRVVRHLPLARTLVVLSAEDAVAYATADLEVTPVETPFGDSHALAPRLHRATGRKLATTGQSVEAWWGLAIAAEILGAGRAAVDLAVGHVKLRRQFNRPIGSFQAIQHRLSQCEVAINALQALARWAAGSQDGQAMAMAAAYGQSAVEQLAFDTQQFHGASGLTKQSDLHFFTYRLRALGGQLGGGAELALVAAEGLWPQARG